MPHPSIYHGRDRSFTPVEFVATYNRFQTQRRAAAAMGIPAPRLSVIASRLRRRGWVVKLHHPYETEA